MSILPKKDDWDLRLDVVPVMKARPVLTPPRSPTDPPDLPLFCYWNPFTKQIELVTELLTIFPHTVWTKDGALIISLGSAVFVGRHLFKGYPNELPERLRLVLGRVYENDKAFGLGSRWVDVTGVSSAWQPPKPEKTPRLFTSKPVIPVA
jgi:hypothetical protein